MFLFYWLIGFGLIGRTIFGYFFEELIISYLQIRKEV